LIESLTLKSLLNLSGDGVSITNRLSSSYLKLLMNYVQTITIIQYLNLDWSSTNLKIFSISQTLSGSFFEIVSLDCLVQCITSYYNDKIK